MISKMAPYNLVPSQPQINKIYNISLSDPLGNHSLINKVYEDVLPGDQNVYTFLKINERDAIKKFMRNSILDKYDGEEYSIKGGERSLLSWIKIFEINPYSLKANPYDDIPKGFLLYRSAYPIRYNKEDHALKTLPTSMAFNLRIYQMSIGADNAFNTEGLNKYNFDIWRDIKYYQEINNIINKKVSPNFINLILYVIDTKSKVGFDKLDIIKKNKDRFSADFQSENDKKINRNKYALTLEDIAGTRKLTDLPLRSYDSFNFGDAGRLEKTIRTFTRTDDVSAIRKVEVVADGKIDMTKSSDKLLIAITEAPNTNIIKWNSKVYQSFGTVKKMVATGYHNPEVWKSVLFQLLYACAVLEKNEIYFNNFSLENNVFIKDVNTDNTGNSCWVYKIDNIEYYVPNYGYIVVIDSNYADITEVSTEQQYKIYGSMYGKLNGSVDCKKSLREKMTDIFNSEILKCTDNTEVSAIINTIVNELNSNPTKLIINIFPQCFADLFNNKIGKLLTKLEKESFNLLNKPDYKSGSLMVRQKRYDEYEWVIYIGDDKNKKIIYTKNDNKLSMETVFSSSLYSYPEIVVPDDKQVIETYTFN